MYNKDSIISFVYSNQLNFFVSQFIMTSCLLHLVITPFMFITNHNFRPLFIVLQIVWISVHLGRLFIIVEPTHRCLEEVLNPNFVKIISTHYNLFQYEKTNPLVVNLLSKVENKEVKEKVKIILPVL